MSKQQLYKDILTEVKASYDVKNFNSFKEFYKTVEIDNAYNDVKFKPITYKPYYKKAYEVLGGNERPEAKVLGKILCTSCGVNCELYWCTVKRKKQILCADCTGAFND